MTTDIVLPGVFLWSRDEGDSEREVAMLLYHLNAGSLVYLPEGISPT